MKKIEIKHKSKQIPVSKKLKKAGKAINLILTISGFCYSLYLLKPKFDTFEVDAESFEQAQREKAESK